MRKICSRGASIATIESLENRRLLSNTLYPAYPEIIGEPIVIGTSKLIDITFTASSGRKTTLSVHGAQAAITFSGTSVPLLANRHGYFPNGSVETVQSILITDAVPGKASLTDLGAAGVGTFNITTITGGDLGSIKLPDVNLAAGSITFDSVKSLTLSAVSGSAINVTKAVGTVKVTGGFNGTLSATTIGSFSAGGVAQSSITSTASYSRNAMAIGSVTAAAGLDHTNIISSGSIGPVAAGFIRNSVISAGAFLTAAAAGTVPADQVPVTNNVFYSAASIKSIRVLNIASGNFFSNSIVTAKTIGSASIGQITGGGGIAAKSLGSFVAAGPTGQLDTVNFHLGSKQLHTNDSLHSTLSHLSVPYTTDASLQDFTLFYNFELNILT